MQTKGLVLCHFNAEYHLLIRSHTTQTYAVVLRAPLPKCGNFVCYFVIQLYCTDLIGRFHYEMQTTEDIYILHGLHFIVKSAYQVRTVELNYKIADEITALWQRYTQHAKHKTVTAMDVA